MKLMNKKAVSLAIVAIAIIVFWLAPGVNSGKERQYVRLYEDVSQEDTRIALHRADTTKKKRNKTYRKEVIRPSEGRKVSAKMFSRAVQFAPLREAPEDSVTIIAEKTDTVMVIR